MWIFTPGGLLMPARTPNGGIEGTADPKFTNDGEYTMQVRGRVESHLTNFIRDYMEPMGLPYSEIERTPQLDYNVRFYTTPEAFSKAVAQAVLDIDFLKFKPTAERSKGGIPLYKDGKAYHTVLNSIWGTLTRLGSPGGWWGARSHRNPQGYLPSSQYVGYGGSRPMTGASFYDRDTITEPDWWTGIDGADELDFVPSRERRVNNLLTDLAEIPVDQWEDELDSDDFALVKPYIPEIRKQEQRLQRMTRRRGRRGKRAS